MKKYLLLAIVAVLPLLSFAKSDNPLFGKYGFSNQTSISAFQQYVGRTVMYLPCTPLSYAENEVFKTQKFIPDAEYVITDISPKDGTLLSYTKITVTFQEKGGKKKLKMKAYADWANDYPFLFIDEFNADKPNLIGKTFSDPLIKGEYRIDDIKLEATYGSDGRKVINYYVSNPVINQSFNGKDLEWHLNYHFKEDKSGGYNSTLVKVEKPENSSERYGDIKTVEEKGVTKYSFEDELISIIIFGGSQQFAFKLTNKSANSIKLIWDEAAFVDYNGSTSKVMHSGIKYSQREAAQPASTIIRGASLDDIACPTSNVRYSDVLKEWVTDSMYPSGVIGETKQVRLMLPIQIKDVVNEYIFVFDVKYSFKHPERLNLPENN